MLYSVFCLAGAENEKTAIAGGLSGFASDCSLNRVNLPLLHRQGAGMAKVKIAGKENVLAHG
ncbi:hypothetical protein LK542_01485 [Massilia sp. IC2-477]|uniref:hypothetical protein n=1 Tax=unclassified Massilia TaxID=2609279 RepID=UPI001D1105D7|nr:MULTISPECIES: hypothetical protein [unclassified Massilia]MCC2954282.1 hypothetical protein [Massilia sp. IC2-477]MCC2971721.1 hypothetical protein [Massilia sp. IC2-476]